MLRCHPIGFVAYVVAVGSISAVDSNNMRQHLFRLIIFKINVYISIISRHVVRIYIYRACQNKSSHK